MLKDKVRNELLFFELFFQSFRVVTQLLANARLRTLKVESCMYIIYALPSVPHTITWLEAYVSPFPVLEVAYSRLGG